MLRINIYSKRFVVILTLCILLIAGHYYFYVTPIPMFELMRIIVKIIQLVLCLSCMLFLLPNSRGIRSRKVFAFSLGMFALAGIIATTMCIARYGEAMDSFQILSPGIMIYGNTFAFICLLYPIELLHRGKLTIWRYAAIYLPALALGLFYFVVTAVSKRPIVEINSWQDMFANIHRFDVWFRFTIFVYPIWMIIKILRYKARYKQWCKENYSDSGYIDLTWINYYFVGYFLLVGSYTFLLLGNNPQSMMMHNICFIVFFGFCGYNIAKQLVPPADDPADDPSKNYYMSCETTENNIYCEQCDPNGDYSDKYRFVDMMPEYKLKLEDWMRNDKPYQNKDFKLLDVMKVLPLNRSYLSRMFNEAYGKTFFSFVMDYRIQDSTHLLTTRPNMTISTIADVCGFSSPSVFGRAFLKSKGITPKQYRSMYGHADGKVAV